MLQYHLIWTKLWMDLKLSLGLSRKAVQMWVIGMFPSQFSPIIAINTIHLAGLIEFVDNLVWGNSIENHSTLFILAFHVQPEEQRPRRYWWNSSMHAAFDWTISPHADNWQITLFHFQVCPIGWLLKYSAVLHLISSQARYFYNVYHLNGIWLMFIF